MIRGFDIVCLSTSPWEAPYGSRQELMSRFARGNRVLFVEYQASWLHPLRYPQLRRSRGWLPGQIRAVADQLWVYTPPLGFPWGAYADSINQWNQRRLVRALRGILDRLGFTRRLLWIYTPLSAPLLGQLDEVFSVYHCIEAFQEERPSGRRQRWLAEYERRLATQCDLVIAGSRQLSEHLKQWRRDVVWMPPGVDLDTFNAQIKRANPKEFVGIRPPILGYVGSIDHRIDFELMEEIGKRFPQATLVLVGAVYESARTNGLRKLANIRMIGPKPKEVLPAFIQRMDVCLIPYRVTPFTQGILPLKLFEYLALGKAVVATALPELQPYASVVRVANDREEFLRAIGDFLYGNRQCSGVTPPHLVSWDERVEEISAAIEERLR